MPEHGGWLLLAAFLASCAGMGWLALSMSVHMAQALGRLPQLATRRVLRTMGAFGIVIALLLCLRADHASMAVLVWIMTLAAGALLVAFLLALRPRALRLLTPWLRPIDKGEPAKKRRR